MEISSFFSKDHVVILEGSEKQLVLKEMIETLSSLGNISNPARYYAQIIHRESLENTGLGYGLAIPHVRTDTVKEFNVLLGIAKNGIDYQAIDSKPVNFILLSIFPTDMSTKYLYLVGMMAKIFSNKKIRDQFEHADNPKQIYSCLQEHANEYYNQLSDKNIKQTTAAENLAGVSSSELDALIRLDRLYHLYDETRKDSVKDKIDEIRKQIDDRSLTYYERMRKKCQSPFSIVEKNSCSGCHMNIPPIELNEIKERRKISICAYCGRFLISI